MKYKQLGKTDMMVSTIALGCWAFAGGDLWGEQDDTDSIATVHAALDVGVNLFDTAPGYGNGYSEEVLGRAVVDRRDEAIIATKVSGGNMTAAAVQKACEDSLRRLQTDYIDLYQIHWPSRTIPLSETVGTLEKLKEQGKVRAIGVCNFGKKDMEELLSLSCPETNQVPYNLIWRAIEYEIQPQCVDQGIGILCYSVLAQALLTGKYVSPDNVPTGGRVPATFPKIDRMPVTAKMGVKSRHLPRLRPFAKSAGKWISQWPMWLWPGCCTSRGSPQLLPGRVRRTKLNVM